MNAFDSSPTSEPSLLVAGDRWAWRRPDLASAYPPADFTLRLRARQERDPEANWSVDSTGDEHGFVVAPAVTAELRPGPYAWSLFAIRDSDSARLTLAHGRVSVAPDPATSSADPRSPMRALRDALEERMQGLAKREHQSYTFEGVSVAAMPLQDVVQAYAQVSAWLEAEEQRDAIAAGRRPGSQILARY